MTIRHRRVPPLARRDVLRGGAGLAAAAMTAPMLAACSGSSADPRARDYPVATPQSPVRLPFMDDNPAIASGLEPEDTDVLKVLNYAQYIAPAVLKDFRKQYGVDVQVTPYVNFDELQRRLLAPGAEYDVVFAGPTIMSRMVYSTLLQPLNRDYVPNLKNLWPEFQDPWYDLGSRYSTPYNVYTYGIGYRSDRVSEVPDNGYMMLWDPQYTGKIGVFDEAVDALSMAMLAWGIHDDVNTSDPAKIEAARDKLIELQELDVRVSIAQYELIPSGKVTIHQAWSGDLVFAADYVTGDTTIDDIGYWVPEDSSQVVIGNETISVGAAAPSPVLAHAFINHLLDNDVAEANVSWTGYQPPIQGLTADYMVEKGIWPEQLRSAVVDASDFAAGLQHTEMTIEDESLWLKAWQEFLSG